MLEKSLEDTYQLGVTDFKPLSLLKEQGEFDCSLKGLGLTEVDAKELLNRMVFTRTWDKLAMNLARQGRLGFYAPVTGQEASIIGTSYGLLKNDWVVPGYRDIPQCYFHGYPLYQAFLWSRGEQHGGEIPPDVNMLIPQIIIGAQYVQAVGIAMGLQKRKKKNVVITYTGDGGSSEGDFYEALNMAGVYQLPVIFVVQNNGYAISTPRKLQTSAQTIAQKGLAAGIYSAQVDGMDVLAVYKVTSEAIERARTGLGPTLIEALTYRMEPHSMSGDDPGRYRSLEEVDSWRSKDPLNRMRQYLTEQNLWSPELEQEQIARAEQEVKEAITKAEKYPLSNIPALIDTVYQVTPPGLIQQKAWFKQKGGV
ncbi:MAG: pyruvate dehydrogenase (acetyl-transferring) component subunit alpha [Bacillota bacterium]|jgi:pyruvate dehydrogenase E1 component alpha subunit